MFSALFVLASVNNKPAFRRDETCRAAHMACQKSGDDEVSDWQPLLPPSMPELEKMEKLQLVDLKRQLIEEMDQIKERLAAIDRALDGAATSEGDQEQRPEYYGSEQFTHRLERHFHTAKQNVLKRPT